jgi:4-alpha-glucanotransferase
LLVLNRLEIEKSRNRVRGVLFRPESDPPNCVVYTGTYNNDTTVGWYRSEQGRNSTRSAEQIAREQHAVRVALSSDGSEIQQVDNLHLHANRNLCY